MNKKLLFTIIIIVLVGILGYVWFINNNKNNPTDGNISTSTQTENLVEYINNQYGFSFSLPKNWEGYSIATSSWEGYALGPNGNIPAEHGVLILIRNPKWTAQNVYQDIPVMIFTLKQWDLLQKDQFHIGAAPIGPTELGRNTQYIFALPARYNFAFPTGWEDVQNILDTHPLNTF